MTEEPEIVYDEDGDPHCSECGGEVRVKNGCWRCLDCGASCNEQISKGKAV